MIKTVLALALVAPAAALAPSTRAFGVRMSAAAGATTRHPPLEDKHTQESQSVGQRARTCSRSNAYDAATRLHAHKQPRRVRHAAC